MVEETYSKRYCTRLILFGTYTLRRLMGCSTKVYSAKKPRRAEQTNNTWEVERKRAYTFSGPQRLGCTLQSASILV